MFRKWSWWTTACGWLDDWREMSKGQSTCCFTNCIILYGNTWRHRLPTEKITTVNVQESRHLLISLQVDLNFWKCISPIQQLIIPFNGCKNKCLNEMSPELIVCLFCFVGFSLFEDSFIFPQYILSLGPAATARFQSIHERMCCVFPRRALIGGSRDRPRLYFRPLTRHWPAGSLLMSLHAAGPLGRLARASGKRRLDARSEFLVGALRRTTTPRSHSIHGRSLWNGRKEIMDWVQWRSQLCSVNHDRRNVSVFDFNKFCKWRSDYEQVVWLCHEHHLLTVVFELFSPV